jgi:lysophospholipase
MDPPVFDRRTWPEGGVLDQWPAPDGWPLRRYRQGQGMRGSLLFVGGRGDTIEKYLEQTAYWAARGWQVTSFDWRGQGGSGRLAGKGREAPFSTWVGDLAAFAAQWRKEGPGPHIAIGHSMGGHILLRALVEGALAPDAAVLVAPMLGLNSSPIPEGIAPPVARLLCALGLADKPLWRHSPSAAARRRRLTHSEERYDDEIWWWSQSPDLSEAPPTWRWIAQAYASMLAVEHSPTLTQMQVPTLILATRADRLVSPAAIARIAARLPHGRFHLYGADVAHEILREVDPVRLDALGRIDTFLDDEAPAR